MDELLGALPENVREPDRKKVGVTAAEMNAAVDFVNTLLRDMQIDAVCAPVACPEGEEYEIVGEADRYPAVEITGSGSGILIGHHGETLDAIQCLLNLASIRKSDHEAGADKAGGNAPGSGNADGGARGEGQAERVLRADERL